jgi:hypothetical protein
VVERTAVTGPCGERAAELTQFEREEAGPDASAVDCRKPLNGSQNVRQAMFQSQGSPVRSQCPRAMNALLTATRFIAASETNIGVSANRSNSRVAPGPTSFGACPSAAADPASAHSRSYSARPIRNARAMAFTTPADGWLRPCSNRRT